jgi:hypothetical protein
MLVAALPAWGADYEWPPKQGPAVARLTADVVQDGRPQVRLSGEIILTLSVAGGAGPAVQPVPLITASPGWRVRSSGPVEKDDAGRWRQQFRLEPLLPGDLPLELQPWADTTWPPLTVRVVTEVTEARASGLRDLPPPEELPPVPPRERGWLWWAVGLGVAAVAAGLAGREWRRRRNRPAPALSPEEEASRGLRHLEARIPTEAPEVERFHTELAHVVRRYAERRFHLRAPWQTTDEFLAATRQCPDLSPAQQELLRDFFRRCDLVKFAQAAPTADECRALAATARTFIEQAETARAAQTLPGGQSGQSTDAPSRDGN